MWNLKAVPRDGSCLFTAVREGLNFPAEYTNDNLRCEIAVFCVNVVDILRNENRIQLFGDGKRAGQTEPFTIKGYLLNLLDSTTWGDSVIIDMISRRWGLKITVLEADKEEEIRFRHNVPLDKADLVLVYASDHYSAAYHTDRGEIKSENMVIPSGLPAEEPLDQAGDRMPRGMYRCSFCAYIWRGLEIHHKQHHKDEVVPSKKKNSHHLAGQSMDSKLKCNQCGRSYSTKDALKRHIKETHDVEPGVLYPCNHCTKSFKSERTRKAHEKCCGDNPDRMKIKCPLCLKGFSQKCRMNDHLKSHSSSG